MRIRSAAVLGLLVAVAVTACGGPSSSDSEVATARSGAAASSSPTPRLSQQEKAVKFGQCMRDNGVPDFPDPKWDDNGNLALDAPEGADPRKVDAAMEKCKQYAPGGGQPLKVDPQMVEQNRRFAKCMRDNGIANFPDPNEQGGLAIDPEKLGIKGRPEDDPKFSAAWKKCEKQMPPLPSGSQGPSTNSRGNA